MATSSRSAQAIRPRRCCRRHRTISCSTGCTSTAIRSIGQKRGVALHSGATWVLNCYISDIKGVGMDTQAIMRLQRPGPVHHRQQLSGGRRRELPARRRQLRRSSTSSRRTSSSAATTCTSRSPGDCRSSRRPPASPPVAGRSGALPAATYSYRVVAARSTAQDAWAYSARSAEVTVAVAVRRPHDDLVGSRGRTRRRIAYTGAEPQARRTATSRPPPTTFVDDGSRRGVPPTPARR